MWWRRRSAQEVRWQRDRCQSSGKDGVFHSRCNLCVALFDSVFIYGLPYGPVSVLAIHPPHSLPTRQPCQRAYICEVTPAAPGPQRGAADTAADYRLAALTAEWTVPASPFEHFITEPYRGELHR